MKHSNTIAKCWIADLVYTVYITHVTIVTSSAPTP